jgi:glycine/D-amino acid oxidase-like deaminating enzyme
VAGRIEAEADVNGAQNGGQGVWFATLADPVVPRPPLTEGTDADVAVIGAGFTGLWTAYYLKKADPALRVVVLEREVAGFGASGRNGGWCHPYLPVSLETLAEGSDRDRAVATQNAMFDAVDEVGRVAAEEGIEQAHFHRGGLLSVATGPEQVARVREEAEYFRSWGFAQHVSWLEPAEVEARLRIAGCRGATFTSRSAVVQPAGLARGLADVVERLGVSIYEKTLVTGFGSGLVATAGGSVRARHVVRATEGYSVGFSGHARRYIPIYSLMIATAPLPDAFWDEVGWAGRETFTDGRHLYIYAARTPDGRIAIGGRGAPYHYRSRISRAFEDVPEVFEKLHRVLRRFFPAVGDVEITHRWGGPLAIPRDWHPSIGLDAPTGLAWAGGYVGDGVSTTNLAGRTLTDLLLGRQTDLTRLPLVNHRNPQWEPEPLRWLGVHASMALLARADRGEARSGKPSATAKVVKKLLGV